MKVNYVFKSPSDIRYFTSDGPIIELKEYQDSLVFYSPLNDYYRAEFAMFDKTSNYDIKPETHSGGPFGSYLKLNGRYSFQFNNFDCIENQARISFWLGSDKITESSKIALVKKENFPEDDCLPIGSYSLTVTVDGHPTSTLIIKCDKPTSIKQLKNMLLWELNPEVYPFKLNVSNNQEDRLLLQSLYDGKTIKVTDGLDGTNLLDYFNVENVEYGSAPINDNLVFSLFNLKIYHSRDTSTGDDKSCLKFKLSDEEFIIPWNTNSIDMDNIEVDFDDKLMFIFLNGKLIKINITESGLVKENETLSLYGTEDHFYSFDELIVNKRCIHTKDFEVRKTQLTKYTTEKPFVDYHFYGKDIKNGMQLKSDLINSIDCCICEDGNFYYYNAGSWRRANGEYNRTNDWYTFSEKLKEFDFSGKDFFIRCFFSSNGVVNAYLSAPYFEMDDELYEDKQGNIAAILIGDKEWNNEGEPIYEDLTGKDLIITTDKGTTTIVFGQTLDPDNPVTPLDEYSLQDVINEINTYYPDGITNCSKDSKDRAVLISETKGEDAFIKVDGEAAPIIFGMTTTAKGTNEDKGTIDYTKFYDTVRTYTSKLIIGQDEIPDEQMRLFLREAMEYYKRWRATDVNQHTCQLKGNWREGFEIPSVIESQKDIIDIIFRPIFPITFYGSDFIANGSENIFTLTLAQSIFGGRGIKQADGITQDYYISLMAMQDFRQTLGLNPTWEIMNNRIYIYPSSVARFTNVAIRYKAPLSEEEALKDPDIIKYVHGKCLMTMGNIRGQYGSNLTNGDLALVFNADSMYQRGKEFVDEVINLWKSMQPPLGFFLG